MIMDDYARRIISCLIACLAGVSHGAMLSWPAEVLPQLTRPTSSLGWVDQNILTWIASISFVGCMLGSLLASPLQKVMSTKMLICSSSLLVTLSWLLVSLSTSPFTLCVFRISLGCGNAVLMATVPAYISGCAPPNVRGALSSCYGLALSLGLMFSVGLGARLPWASLSLLATLPSLLLFISSPFLHTGHKSVTAQPEITNNSPTVTVDRPLLLFSYLAIMYSLSGIGPLGSFPEQLFSDKRTFIASDLAMASLVCQTVGGLVGATAIDKLGRKPVLQAGAWLCLLANILLSLYFSTVDSNFKCPASPGSILCWTPAVATCIFLFGFGGGLGNVFFVLMGELIPADRITTIIPLVTFFFNFLQFGVIKTFLFFNMVIGTANIFFLQAGMNILFLFGQAAWIPETRPKLDKANELGEEVGASYGTFVPSNVQVNRYSVASGGLSSGGQGVEFVLNSTEFFITINKRD